LEQSAWGKAIAFRVFDVQGHDEAEKVKDKCAFGKSSNNRETLLD
jgi:hypothetical protein